MSYLSIRQFHILLPRLKFTTFIHSAYHFNCVRYLHSTLSIFLKMKMLNPTKKARMCHVTPYLSIKATSLQEVKLNNQYPSLVSFGAEICSNICPRTFGSLDWTTSTRLSTSTTFNSSFQASHYHNIYPFQPMSYSLYLKPTCKRRALEMSLV